jgi:predicted GH43/DUF377 family glycosyl hydrolase
LAGGDFSLTFRFEQEKEPVLGAGLGWDAGDVLNPSVVSIGGTLINFYSGFDGKTWRTGVALSTDGVRWQRQGMVLQPDPASWEGSYIAANGAATFREGEFLYWYAAGASGANAVGLARARGDARGPNAAWRKEDRPVLPRGPWGSWDEISVADPYVVRIEPYFYMYYLGQDRARRQRIGLARSLDGVRWEKLRANPVLELGDIDAFDEMGLGEPAVWTSQGYYWMLYTGIDASVNRRLGLARSTDGVHWAKLPAVFSGSEAWDSKVVCDPTVDVAGDVVRVWFGGGDVASRDENLHGRIGYGVLRPVNDTLTK